MSTYAPDVEALLGPSAGIEAAPPPVVQVPATGGGTHMIAGDPYEGASRFDTSVALWDPTRNSADGDILGDKPVIDARAKDSIRNDAFVAGAAGLHRDGIVGAMFLLNAKPASRVLFGKPDLVWEAEFQEEIEEEFTLAAESPNNWFDASRQNTFTELVRLAVGGFVPMGEVLATVEWLNKDSSRPFSTAIQMVDPDRLSTPPEQMSNKRVRAGILRDGNNAPQTYFIQVEHPADWQWMTFVDAYRWKPVPVRKPWGRPQVIHIFEQSRVDQSRGISEMVTALRELRVGSRFRDIVLQNAVLNATYAATIESDLDTQAVFARLGGGSSPDNDEYAKAIRAYTGGYLQMMQQFMSGAKNLNINGVKIPHLPPGTKLQLQGAGQGGPLGGEFETSLNRRLAAALGVSTEQFTHNFSDTNYSGFKAALNQTEKFMASRKKSVADRFANIIFRCWLEEKYNKGTIRTLPLAKHGAGWLYEDMMRLDALAAAEWIGASRGQIDELKETQAAVLRMNNNLSTLEDELSRLGRDWRKSLPQRARERALMMELKLPLNDTPSDTTNMTNASTGAPRDKTAASGGVGTAANLFLDAPKDAEDADD